MSLTQCYTRIYDGASRLQHTARNLKRGRVTENNCKAIRSLSVGTWSSNAGYMLISNMLGFFRHVLSESEVGKYRVCKNCSMPWYRLGDRTLPSRLCVCVCLCACVCMCVRACVREYTLSVRA